MSLIQDPDVLRRRYCGGRIGYLPLTAYRLPLTAYHLPLTAYRLPLTALPPLHLPPQYLPPHYLPPLHLLSRQSPRDDQGDVVSPAACERFLQEILTDLAGRFHGAE